MHDLSATVLVLLSTLKVLTDSRIRILLKDFRIACLVAIGAVHDLSGTVLTKPLLGGLSKTCFNHFGQGL